MTEGSSLESDIDAALDDTWLLVKGFSAFCLYSSSFAFCLRCRSQKNNAPAIAENTVTPTTTPATMAALLGPFDAFVVETGAAAFVCPGAVTTTVLARVITDGGAFWLKSGEAAALGFGEAAGFVLELAFEAAAEADAEADAEEPAADGLILVTALLRPVSCTDQKPWPPQ